MLGSSQKPLKRLRGRWQLQEFLLKMLLSKAVLKKAAQSLVFYLQLQLEPTESEMGLQTTSVS